MCKRITLVRTQDYTSIGRKFWTNPWLFSTSWQFLFYEKHWLKLTCPDMSNSQHFCTRLLYYMSICLSISISVCLSVCLSAVWLFGSFVHLFVFVPVAVVCVSVLSNCCVVFFSVFVCSEILWQTRDTPDKPALSVAIRLNTTFLDQFNLFLLYSFIHQ